MNLLHADAGGLRARFEQPGAGYAGREFAKIVVIENVDEFGDEDAGFAGARAHGQLVAKIADGGEARAGNAEMLAEGGDIFHVEFIERDDAVDGMGPGYVTYGIDQTLQGEIFGHGEDFVDTFERPIGMAEFFDSQEQDDASHRFAGADEFLALFVGTDAENGERPALRHATPPRNRGTGAVPTCSSKSFPECSIHHLHSIVGRSFGPNSWNGTGARIIQRPRARDTGIAETGRRAAPRPLRCAPRLQRPRNANRGRASSLFRAARRETSRLAEQCADLPACRRRARCAA